MRCAACEHRWLREAVPAPLVPEPLTTPVPIAAAKAEPESPPPSHLLRTFVAIVVSAALAIGAGAVWVARIEPQSLPVIGGDLAALAPAALPLQLRFTAHTAPLPAGGRLLEINGSVRNTGKNIVSLPDLEARLSAPAGTVRRWRIAAPVTRLAPGASATFVSTATGFPENATIVGIRPAR